MVTARHGAAWPWHNVPMNSRSLAKVLVWVEALALTLVGVIFVTVRSVEVARIIDRSPDTDTYEVTGVSVLEIGLVLLPVGLLILAALLIVEGYRGGNDRPAMSNAEPVAFEGSQLP